MDNDDADHQGQSAKHMDGIGEEPESVSLDCAIISSPKGGKDSSCADISEDDESEDIDSDALRSDEEEGDGDSIPSSYDKVTLGEGDAKSSGNERQTPDRPPLSAETTSVPQQAPPRTSGRSRVRRPRVKGETGNSPYPQVLTDFEAFLRQKEQQLAPKTIQMYRWMTGSVLRKIDGAVPGMTNDELKAYVAREADHIVSQHVEWESQGFRHCLEFFGVKKVPMKRKVAPKAPDPSLSTGLLVPLPGRKKAGHCEAIVTAFKKYLREEKGLLKGIDNSTRAIAIFLAEALGDDLDRDTTMAELAAFIEGNKDYVADLLEEAAAENGQLAMAWKRFVTFMENRGHNIDIDTKCQPYRGLRRPPSAKPEKKKSDENHDRDEGVKRPGPDSSVQEEAKRQKLVEQASELASLRSRVIELTRGQEDLMIALNQKEEEVRDKDRRIRELKAEVEERLRRGRQLEQDNHSLRRELRHLEDQMQALPRVSPPLPSAAGYPLPSVGTFMGPLAHQQDSIRSLGLAAEQLRRMGHSPLPYLPRSTMTSTSSSSNSIGMASLPPFPPSDAAGLNSLYMTPHMSQLHHYHAGN